MKHCLRLCLLCLCAFSYNVGYSTTYTVTPDTDAATIRNALNACSAGDTLIVEPGDYGTQQYIGNYKPEGEVTIVFPSQTWFESILQLVDCHSLTIENLWQRIQSNNSQPSIRIKVNASDSKNITIRNCRIDAQYAKHGIEIEGVSGSELPEDWPDGVTIENTEIYSSNGDLIQVSGVNHLIVRDCYLHDPIIAQGTSDHIDGIQVIRGRSIYILDNWITFVESAPTYVRNPSGPNPHQGVILSTVNSQTISHFEIRNNRFVDWDPGTPIIVSGTGVSDGTVCGNTLVNCYDAENSVGIVIDQTVSNVSDFLNISETFTSL